MNCRKLLFIVVAALVFSGCQEEKKPEKAPIKPAKVMTIGDKDDIINRKFSGKIISATKAELSFEVEGKLIKLPVLEGDRLKKDDLIASIDPHHYQEQVKKAEAEYELATAQFKRAKALLPKNFISKSEYDILESKANVAASQLSQAKKDLKDTVLKAPFDGIVIKKYVDNYEFVKAKQPIVNYHDLGDVDVEIFVPENIVIQVKKSAKIEAEVSFDVIKKSYPVNLKEFSAKADPDTQTYRTVFTFKAPTDFNVLPGMTVTVTLNLPDYRSQGQIFYRVPVSAVFSDEKGNAYVWLVDKNNTLQKQPVKTGELIDQDMRIYSGIKPGQMIVSAGVHYLREGQQIRPVQARK